MSEKQNKIPKEFQFLIDQFKTLSSFQSLPLINIYEENESLSAKALRSWINLGKKLPSPWPQEVLDELVSFRPTNGNSSELLRWVNKVGHRKDEKLALEALKLIFKNGIRPSQYIPQSGVSLAGAAAYNNYPEAMEFFYKFDTKENLRLTLLPTHTSDKDFIGSTLLHRLVQRSQGTDKYFTMAEIILKYDPQCVLQTTKAGLTPDQTSSGPVATLCAENRARLEKEMLLEATSDQLQQKGNLPPRKM